MKPIEVHPAELVAPDGSPRGLAPRPKPLADVARRLGLTLEGPALEIGAFGPLSAPPPPTGSLAIYFALRRYASALAGRTGLIVITRPALRSLVPEGNAVLCGDADPADTFASVLADFVEGGDFETLGGYVSPSARIAGTAVIGQHVYVDRDAAVGAGSVLLGPTYVGPGVIIKPNATIGGNGFQTAMVAGRRRVVPHAGGVWLSEGVEVGSGSCVDKGFFGDFTVLGPDTKLDNLVHFGHSGRTGRGCTMAACAEFGRSVMGDGVWLGPGVRVNQGITIGNHAFVGTGSVITRDIPAHSLAFGVPAKVAGYVCICRTKVAFHDGVAVCERCDTQLFFDAEGVHVA